MEYDTKTRTLDSKLLSTHALKISSTVSQWRQDFVWLLLREGSMARDIG
jgi:hypothetical protein